MVFIEQHTEIGGDTVRGEWAVYKKRGRHLFMKQGMWFLLECIDT